MKRIISFVALPLLTSLLAVGCATQKVASVQPVSPLPAKTITARGYGTVNRDQQYRLTPAQRKLMAIRASKMDALRELAEQVYGVRLSGHTTVEDMTVKNDGYRAYVDAFIRGAHVKNTVTSGTDRDTYETVMELELTPTFYQCLFGNGQCTYQYNPPVQQSLVAPSVFNPASNQLNCNSDDCYPYPDSQGFKTN